MEKVPVFNARIKRMFTEPPPTFFYYQGVSPDWNGYLAQYTRLLKDGGKTDLYVLPDKLLNLTEQQKEELRFYKFEI